MKKIQIKFNKKKKKKKLKKIRTLKIILRETCQQFLYYSIYPIKKKFIINQQVIFHFRGSKKISVQNAVETLAKNLV